MPEIAKGVESAKVTKSPGSELVDALEEFKAEYDSEEIKTPDYGIEHTSTHADRKKKKRARRNRRDGRLNKKRKK